MGNNDEETAAILKGEIRAHSNEWTYEARTAPTFFTTNLAISSIGTDEIINMVKYSCKTTYEYQIYLLWPDGAQLLLDG